MTLSRCLLVLLLALLMAPAHAQQEETNPDPFESFNRKVFALNDVLDRYLMRPLAKGYDFVTPDPLQRGVGNAFDNMSDFTSAINGVLQWRWGGAARDGGRFVINSTLGLLGFFDVATQMGIAPYRTDFGHTLAIWGADSGPYLMVPLFGPRTIRSGAGSIVDLYTSVPNQVDDRSLRYALRGLEMVDARARLLQAEELVSGDRYIFMRDAYLQRRRTLVNDGAVDDNFSHFEDGEDWEEF